MAIFRSLLDVVIRKKRGVWRFTSAVTAVCLAYSLAATVGADWLEAIPPKFIIFDICSVTFNVLVLTLPLTYYAARSNLALYQAKSEAERKSLTDPLTGLMNRRAFMQRSEIEGGGQQALVVFDLDRFKRVNDIHGHQAGDLSFAGSPRRCSRFSARSAKSPASAARNSRCSLRQAPTTS